MTKQEDDKIILRVMTSFPRSGTHWLKQMISEVLKTPAIQGRVVDRVLLIEALRSEAGKRLVYDHFEYSLHSGILDPAKTKNLRIILLYRHPMDALISMFYRFRATGWLPDPNLSPIDHVKTFLRFHNGQKALPDQFRLTQFYLLFPLRQYVYERVIAWLLSNRCLPVRYEDLVADAQGQLRKVMEHIEFPCTSSELAHAVESSAFEQLSGGRSRGDVDENSHYRKGIPEEWKSIMDSNDIEIVQREIGDYLEILGYGQESQSQPHG